MKLKFLVAISCAAMLYGCDDSTLGIGDFVAENDKINAYSTTFQVETKTVSIDGGTGKGIYSRTSHAYLGKYTDPDFGLFTADFITQVNCPEGFRFPETLLGIEETSLHLYYSTYYGDPVAPMKVGVNFIKDDANITDDGSDPNLYYTSYNPNDYADNEIVATKNYTAKDLSVSDSIRNSSGYYPSVDINMDGKKPIKINGKTYESFSKYLFEAYQNNNGNFDDAETFINNVLKGFYVHTINGEGSVLYIGDIWLRTKIKYTIRNKANTADSIVYSQRVFPATKEVFMSTRIENDSKLEELKNEKGHTYLKTPAGLCTEVTLPIEDMHDEVGKDTLNSVTLKFTKFKDAEDDNSGFKMGTPQYLLMVRADEMIKFFEEGKIPDNRSSFISEYNKSVNGYRFSSLNRLISKIFNEKDNSSADNKNKVLLVPVKIDKDNNGKIISVTHDLEINSAKLFGGIDGEKINMEVIYTRPAK